MIKISNKNKKADANMWWIIAIAIIVLVVIILILIWFRGSGDKAFGEVGGKIDSLGDYDDDKIANMWDKCPCKPAGNNPDVEGCPDEINKNTSKEDSSFTNKSCYPKN